MKRQDDRWTDGAEHPEVNIHTILPRAENIKKVLAALSQIEEKAQSVFTGEADI